MGIVSFLSFLVCISLLPVAANANVFELRRSGHDHSASSGSGSQTRFWRAAWQFQLTAGTYEWKLQYRTCKDDRFVWTITNTSGSTDTARQERAEAWAATNFVYSNTQREALRDSPGSSIQENIGLVPPSGGKLYQFIFNTSKSEACAATGGGHDNHDDHRRHSDSEPPFTLRRSGNAANMFVPKLQIQTDGYYVIFADRNWEADYEGGLYINEAKVSAAKEEFPGVLSAAQLCPTGHDDDNAATSDLDRDRYIFATLCVVAGIVGGVLPLVVTMCSGGSGSTPNEICMMLASGLLFAMFIQFYISEIGPENEGLLANNQTGKYSLQYAIVIIGLCLMVVIEAVIPDSDAAPSEEAEQGTEVPMGNPIDEDSMEKEGIALDDMAKGDDRQSSCLPTDDVRSMCSTSGPPTGSGNGGEVGTATEAPAAPVLNYWKLTNTVLLIMALAATYCFEGMLLGMEKQYNKLEDVFITVCYQVFAAGVGIGAAAADSNVHVAVAIFGVVCFSIWPLIGCIIGMDLQPGSTERNNSHGSIMALTGGIMLYVSLIQLLKPYYKTKQFATKVVFCVVWSIGAGSMLLLAIIKMDAAGEDND